MQYTAIQSRAAVKRAGASGPLSGPVHRRRGRKVRMDVHRRLPLECLRDSTANFYDVGRLRSRRALRTVLTDGIGQLNHRARPLCPFIRLLHVRHGFVGPAVLRKLDARVEVLPAIEVERAEIAVELDALLLAVLPNVKIRRQARQETTAKLERRRDEVGRVDMKRYALFGHAVGVEHGAVGVSAPRRAEDGRQYRQRVDPDVEERANLVEWPWGRMPRLDPPPIDLGVGDPRRAEPSLADRFPGRLLRLTQKGDG